MYYSFFFRKEVIGIVGLLIGLITPDGSIWRQWSSTGFGIFSRVIDELKVLKVKFMTQQSTTG